MARKMSRGRQKIEMIKIKKESTLLSTFSKRRLSIFKTASEMCYFTNAEVALIVFSPKANTPYSFGSPSVQSVINRYQNPTSWPNTTIDDMFIQSQRLVNLKKLIEELMVLENKLKEEEKLSQKFDRIISERKGKYWWESPTEDLNLEQLEQMLVALQSFHPKNMTTKLQNIFRTAEDPDSFHQTNNVVVESNVLDPFEGVVGYSSALSTTNNGGILVEVPYLSTMSGTNFNRMALFDLAPAGFGVSQCAAFPSSNHGGISISEASWLTMARSSSNQLANLDDMEMASALEYAGPSRINMASS